MNKFKKEDINFHTCASIVTEHEKKLYTVLSEHIDTHYHNQYIICPKVRVVDIVNMPKDLFNYATWQRVKSRHIDFLVCTKEDLKPVLAIELQDSTHNTKKGIYRDTLINTVFQSAWLPLLPLWTTSSSAVGKLLEVRL